MTLDECLNAANQLNEAELGTLLDRLWLPQARCKAPILPSQEASLLMQINQGIPVELHQRYHSLAEKRDATVLTDLECEE